MVMVKTTPSPLPSKYHRNRSLRNSLHELQLTAILELIAQALATPAAFVRPHFVACCFYYSMMNPPFLVASEVLCC